ncbi:MAG: hypothetical protein RIC55_18270 [Pirellulaceae bacterium]
MVRRRATEVTAEQRESNVGGEPRRGGHWAPIAAAHDFLLRAGTAVA